METQNSSAVPYEERIYLPNFIPGTPETGRYDRLDPSWYSLQVYRPYADKLEAITCELDVKRVYSSRKGECSQCFTQSPLAVLLSIPGITRRILQYNSGSRYSHRSGVSSLCPFEKTLSTLCTFLAGRGQTCTDFISAIATYGKQATLKPNCRPSEHAVIYNTGIDPEYCYLDGEKDRGLFKEAVEVRPADQSAYLTPESRIRFGKAYCIEWNVKVKDIGMVISEHIPRLLTYFEDENHEVA